MTITDDFSTSTHCSSFRQAPTEVLNYIAAEALHAPTTSVGSSPLWAAPAPIPSYIATEPDETSVIANTTTTTPLTTRNAYNRSLWAAPAEPPSLYSPPQSATEYLQTSSPSDHQTNYSILGHHRQHATPIITLTSPSLSPINSPYLPLHDTFTYNYS